MPVSILTFSFSWGLVPVARSQAGVPPTSEKTLSGPHASYVLLLCIQNSFPMSADTHSDPLFPILSPTPTGPSSSPPLKPLCSSGACPVGIEPKAPSSVLAVFV